jgi:tripartite-type tricarboxylate transporter receptor subunit TctC
MRKLSLLTAIITGMMAGAPSIQAQDYPNRVSRIVVPFAAGATNDIIARLAAQGLADEMKQPFLVDNRAGASGIPGTDHVAKAAPDGYTLLLGNTSLLGIQASLFKKLPYDPRTDFIPVSILATSPIVMVINPSVAAQNVREFVALAQASPGKLNYASAGVGTPFHLAAELFKTQTGTNIVHVAYKGAAPAATDLLSGQVQMMLDNPPAILPHIRSGKVRAIATMGSSRFPLLPDVPTLTESGFRNAEAVSWFAIAAPKGTPREIVVRLNAELVKIVNRSDIRQKFLDLGAEPVGNSPEAAATHVRNEIVKWAALVKSSGATAEE